MKSCPLLALAGVVAMGAGSAMAEPARYVIDPNHFSIVFAADHIGFEQVYGMFLEGSGEFVFDEDERKLSELEVTIDAASVFTNFKNRDQHLRSGDFLDAKAHPEIVFTMTSAEPTGERTGTVTGDLTMRGETHPVTLDVTWNKSASYPYNDDYAIGISARTTIRRSTWGMTYAVDNGWVADDIPLIFELEAIRQD